MSVNKVLQLTWNGNLHSKFHKANVEHHAVIFMSVLLV